MALAKCNGIENYKVGMRKCLKKTVKAWEHGWFHVRSNTWKQRNETKNGC